jgi:hypothetical protein
MASVQISPGSDASDPLNTYRFNVLAALNAITHEIFTVQHLTSITAETVCALWSLVGGASPGMPITVV